VLYTGSVFPTVEQAPALRWVQLDTSGADHVVGSPLWAREDVRLTSIGGVSPRPIAGYVLLMLLAFAHRMPRIVEHQRRREWPTFEQRWERFMPARLEGSTLVVVGYGRLGRAVAEAARGFGIRVVGVRRGGARGGERVGDLAVDAADEVVDVGGLHAALARADHVVVTTPYTPETHHLIGAAALAATKPGAVLVNVARGGVVDEAALLAALDAGTVAGYAADVFATEPLPVDHPLWTHPRAIVTPHVAGFAPDYRERVGELFRENLARFAAGRPLVNEIDRRLGY
jgi:phosphoglycerate dehydrogenase-like enzyme